MPDYAPEDYLINENEIFAEDIYKNTQGYYVVWHYMGGITGRKNNSLILKPRSDRWRLFGVSEESIKRNMVKLTEEEKDLYNKRKLLRKLSS